jgi:hypothetical protein
MPHLGNYEKKCTDLSVITPANFGNTFTFFWLLLANTIGDIVGWLQNQGLIPKGGEVECPKCGTPLVIGTRKQAQEGVHLRCPKPVKTCRFERSIRKGTIFQWSHFSIQVSNNYYVVPILL